MNQTKTISGQDLREMFVAAGDWLEKSVADINALNVFPVPDGDCGTNMLLTTRSCVEEASTVTSPEVSSIAQAIAKGALMGARGNSGVILSQIWRGFARSLSEKEYINGNDLADALLLAAETAYKGMSNPVEGTILTVIREAASAAQQYVESGNGDLTSVLEATVSAAREAVANTPSLLPVLMEAGVVDAGGQGLYTMLEGALLYLRGETALMQSGKSAVIASSIPLTAQLWQVTDEEEVPFGYCTELLLKGENLDPDEIKSKLESEGQSLIVVGDESTVRVHIHVLDPGGVLHYASSLGTMQSIHIRNMDEQHKDFLEIQRKKGIPAVNVAVVAVAAGDGLADVFNSLGVSAVIPGGQTMNPSTRDILQAVEVVPTENIIILPNNKNIVLTAQQVETLSDKNIKVVPAETIPQGMAAMMAFAPEADFETTVSLMNQDCSTVKTIEITYATRTTRTNGLAIEEGQIIGLLEGEILAAGDSAGDVVIDLLSKMDLDEAEVVTIYYGVDSKEIEAEQVNSAIHEYCPSLEVEIVNGGQPHYNYIISVE
ncbi:DAK2 domain-containing protein [Chloroflexota bacterium]